MNNLPHGLREFIELLNSHNVRYLIVGGMQRLIGEDCAQQKQQADHEESAAEQEDRALSMYGLSHGFSSSIREFRMCMGPSTEAPSGARQSRTGTL